MTFNRLKQFYLLCLFLLFIQTAHTQTYQIRIQDQPSRKVLVTYNFIAVDSVLEMSGRGAYELEDRWATFVKDLRLKTKSGEYIPLVKNDRSRWTFDAPEGTSLQLEYEIVLEHEKHQWNGGFDGAAYQTDWGLFFTGRSLFITDPNIKESLEVSFELPETWKVSSSWEELKGSPNSFIVPNNTQLTESLLFAGTHQEIRIERDDFELVLALGGKSILDTTKDFEDLAKGVLDYYTELFGGLPKPSADNPFKKVLVVINESGSTDGEVIGNHISILLEKEGDAMASMIARFIFVHEFFHLWNGKSFIPANLECEWFKEGISNYYTLKALYQVGFLNEGAYFNVMNQFFYQRYSKDPGIGSVAMSDGDQKHDHWGIIYSGGMFVGMAQDIMIREHNNNQKSLDDLMRKLYDEYGGTERRYTLDYLMNEFSAMTGEDQSQFFESYVKGVEKLPINEQLSSYGLLIDMNDDQLSIQRNPSLSDKEQNYIEGLFGSLNP